PQLPRYVPKSPSLPTASHNLSPWVIQFTVAVLESMSSSPLSDQFAPVTILHNTALGSTSLTLAKTHPDAMTLE
ncbi:hypothetical protein JMJ77_0014023, partial [Colletotrichum scovillei]